MIVSETGQSVNAFFESYRLAFERLEASAIANHFAYPYHVTSYAREIVLSSVASKQEWISEIELLLAMYRAIRFSSARILNLASTQRAAYWELSPSEPTPSWGDKANPRVRLAAERYANGIASGVIA